MDETIALLTQGESSARKRALLVEARRLRSRIASWRAIPPPAATKKEAFESAMHLLRKAGAEAPGPPASSAPPPSPPQSGVTAAARVASSAPPTRPTSSGPPSSRPVSSGPPFASVSFLPLVGPTFPSDGSELAPKREVIREGITILRPRSIKWKPFRFLEGVDMKVLLREEGGRFRAIVRLAPGAEIPRHKHVLEEDILMLEGTLVSDGVGLLAGELCHSQTGSIHAVARAPQGCVFLLIGSENNELIVE